MKETGKSLSWRELEADKNGEDIISMDKIETNPFQPRSYFDEEKIREMAQSIKTYGLLQPIIVRPKGENYELVVGERRLIACRSLGWSSIRAVKKNLSDNAVATVALIENLQRENLSFVEEAEGYARLINEFNLTQEVLAQRLGKSQSTIANKLRLLRLPEEVKKYLDNGNLTERHARALLKLEDENQQLKIIKEIVEKGLNVKQTEKKVEDVLQKPERENKNTRPARGVVRDMRIFLNTIRQALEIIENAGLSPEVKEIEENNYYEVIIRLPKKTQTREGMPKS